MLREWQVRPLSNIYIVAWLDAMYYKVRVDGKVLTRVLYSVIGLNLQGKKEILGIYLTESEGAKFWLSVLQDFKQRGVNDIFIACVDGLKGFPEAIESVFPSTQIQLCIPLAGAAAWNSNGNANGINVDSKFMNNAFTSGKALEWWAKGLLFAHEFGHNLGLIDLYAYNGIQHRFVGDYSLMGLISGIAPELLGWERWTLGWLDDNQIVCQGNVGNGSVNLTPIETAGGVKLLTIPIDTKSTIVVESRRKLGYDKNLVKEGPLVYLVDASIATGNGAVKVLPINETDIKKHQATMSVGQTITYQGITITYTSRSNDGDVITFEKK